MRYSNNNAINDRLIEAIMAISKFSLEYLPEDYVLMIDLWKTTTSSKEWIRLIIGNVNPHLVSSDFKII